MRRVITAAALVAALTTLPVGMARAEPLVEPGGQCNGAVDVFCRWHICQPDELDCGMIPPCLLWVDGTCLL